MYYFSEGVVPKGNLMYIKASLSNIEMHVDKVVAFAYIPK